MNDIHLWLGIGSGIILFIICATGTIYVFAKEITEWVDSEKFHVNVPASSKFLQLSQLVTTLEKEKKDSKVTGIQIPDGKDKAWLFTFTPKDILLRRSKEEKEAKQKELKSFGDHKDKKKSNSSGKDSKAPKDRKKGMSDRERIKTYLVNPYNGQIQGDARTPTSKFFTTIMGLHRWLLLDHSIGRPITGVATILFILIELTGLILWLPAKIKSWTKWNAWKAGFKIKTDAKWKRINHDLHNTLGFYTFSLLTLMALTGLCFSFEWFRDGVGEVFGAKPFAERKGVAVQSKYTGEIAFELHKLVHKANEVFAYPGDIRIAMPKDSLSAVTISKIHNGFLVPAGTDRVSFDQYNGSILQTELFEEKRTGEQIVALIYPLHVGEVFGTFTKIIYFIACLIATSLPVTGTIIWINKLRKKPSKNNTSVSEKKLRAVRIVKPNIKLSEPVLKSAAHSITNSRI